MIKTSKTGSGLYMFILKIILPPGEQEEKAGDIAEVYNQLLHQKGFLKANCWIILQIMKLMPPNIMNRITWGSTMLSNYTKVAIRNIRKNKVFSLINISGLAIAFACSFLIFLYVKNQLSYDNFFHDYQRLYRVETAEIKEGISRMVNRKTSFPVADALKREFPEIENSARFLKRGQKTFKFKEKIFSEDGLAFVDKSFLEIFKFDFLQGDEIKALENVNSIVIAQSLAKKYFGKNDPIGQTMTIDNKFDVTVTAVMDDIPENSHFKGLYKINCFVPLDLQKKFEIPMLNWESFYLITYVKLRNSIDFRNFNKKIEGYLGKKNENFMKYNIELVLHPVRHILLYGINGERTGVKILYLYSLLGLIILLVACINYMNLTTAIAAKRIREIVIRRVVGSKKSKIICQFLWESVILSMFALGMALILVKILGPFFSQLTGTIVRIKYSDLLYYFPVFFLAALITGLISGSYPAFFLSSYKLVHALKESRFWGRNRLLFRRLLVVAQLSLSIIFIICTITTFTQFNFMLSKKIGIEKGNIVCFNRRTSSNSRYQVFKNEIQQNPNIEYIGGASVIPGYSTSIAFQDVTCDGKPVDVATLFHGIYVDYDFFRTLKIRLLEGTTFQPGKVNNSDYIIINKMAADIIGNKKIVGSRISFGGETKIVIGVMENFPVWSLKHAMEPLFALFNPEKSVISLIKFKNFKNEFIGTVDFIKDKYRKYFPEFPFEYHILENLNRDLYQQEGQLRTFFVYLTILSILICCLGIFGMVSFILQQKLREISIRKVMGANVTSIAVNLLKEPYKCVLIANLITIPVAWYLMSKWLQNFVYRINMEIGFVITAFLISVLFVLFPVLGNLRKAGKVNPVEFLKGD